MPRGRRADTPAQQEAKGNPSKKKRRRDALPSAEDRAAALAARPAEGKDVFSPPRFMNGEKHFGDALAIWCELAPELRKMRLLENLDRFTFAMYCVHMSDWISASKDIAKNGTHKDVKNMNGDPMPRLNPAVRVRELAERHIIDIGSRFGLNPADRYRVLRDQAGMPLGGLFDKPGEKDEPGEVTSAESAGPETPIGLMRRRAAPPPGSLPN